jgi:tRNA(adenine34) deaminase
MPTTRKSDAKKKSTSKKRWVKTVTTDSTHPPKDLFTKGAAVIARSLASKKVSPKGPASGMRMLTYFINRAGKGLSATRRRELERAKKLLHARIEKDKEKRKQAA